MVTSGLASFEWGRNVSSGFHSQSGASLRGEKAGRLPTLRKTVCCHGDSCFPVDLHVKNVVTDLSVSFQFEGQKNLDSNFTSKQFLLLLDWTVKGFFVKSLLHLRLASAYLTVIKRLISYQPKHLRVYNQLYRSQDLHFTLGLNSTDAHISLSFLPFFLSFPLCLNGLCVT